MTADPSAPNRPSDGETRSVGDRLFDVFVFAPIGAIADVQATVVRLAGRGRSVAESRLHTARAIGQLVVGQGRAELKRRLHRPGSRPRTQVPLSSEPAPPVAPVAPAAPVAPPLAEGPLHDPSAASDLAIADYDSLAASQVVARLEGLSPGERAAIARYETAHRGRRTILGKIAQLDSAN